MRGPKTKCAASVNMSPTLSASFTRARARAKLETETTSPAPRQTPPPACPTRGGKSCFPCITTTGACAAAFSPACKFPRVTDLRIVPGGGDLCSSVSVVLSWLMSSHWIACSSPRHVRSSSKKNLSHMLARGADEDGPLDGRCDVVLAADALLVTQLEASLLQHPHSGELGPDPGLAQDPADARPARSASLSQPRLASMPRQASMLCRLCATGVWLWKSSRPAAWQAPFTDERRSPPPGTMRRSVTLPNLQAGDTARGAGDVVSSLAWARARVKDADSVGLMFTDAAHLVLGPRTPSEQES